MSLIRQIWLLLLGMVLLAFAGSFAVWMVSARGYLETQLQLKNSDNAQSLALTLSQQHGDAALMELSIAAQFDTGFYRSIRLVGPDGRVVLERQAGARSNQPAHAPGWFVALTPVESRPGVAQVSDGWRPLGTLEVVSQSSFAHDQLWRGSLQTGLWLVLTGLLAGGLATLGVRQLQKPLKATADQAQALVERRFITVAEPRVPELARLTRAMNAVVGRLKAVFDEQAQQVEALRVQAHCDPLTGLAHRGHVLAQLSALLARGDGEGQGLIVLTRVMRLADLNRDLGHARTDRFLKALAQGLSAQARQGGEGAVLAGRLNGGDFIVALPLQGAADAQAQALVDHLRQVGGEHAAGAGVVAAGVKWQRGMQLTELLAAADEALARAESRGAFSLEMFQGEVGQRLMHGEDEWRRRISVALAERRAQLDRQPVLRRDGQLVHHVAALSLQIDPNGGFDPAPGWLPLALRTGLMPAVDELAVGLALEQIASDGLPRCVSLAPASLSDSGYLPRLRMLLTAAPRAASRLWLEVAESAAVERFELVRELCKQLRPFGVQVGLHRAGERLTRIGSLVELGLDFVKLDETVVSGVAGDPARVAHVRGMASMLHGLGLQVYAEAGLPTDDAEALWACGVDGAPVTAD